jgi:hypothetical protein
MDRRGRKDTGIGRDFAALDGQTETEPGRREVTVLSDARKQREKKRYADLVMKAWADLEHADRRAYLDKKGDVQIKARERL